MGDVVIACIEGGDAVGKNTQSKILAERLNAKRFAFPNYKTETGQAILGNLTEKWSLRSPWNGLGPAVEPGKLTHINAMVLQSLFLANRMECQEELKLAAINHHIVLDRYTMSGEVYGALDGLDTKWLRAMNDALPVQPDVYILLDAPVDEGFRRRPERRDRYETDRERLELVRAKYVELFKERAELYFENNRFTSHAQQPIGANYRIVDAVGTVDEVAARIWDCVKFIK